MAALKKSKVVLKRVWQILKKNARINSRDHLVSCLFSLRKQKSGTPAGINILCSISHLLMLLELNGWQIYNWLCRLEIYLTPRPLRISEDVYKQDLPTLALGL